MAAVRTDDRRWALVDAEGRQLDVVDAAAVADLPRIEGLDPPADAGSELPPDAAGALELASRLSEAVPAGAVRVMVAAGGSMEAVVERPDAPEVRALFGRADRLGSKVVALVTLLGDNEERTGRLGIDVRVPDAPVLTGPAQ